MPLFRVDETVLFGRYLFEKGIKSHLCAHAEKSLEEFKWKSGENFIKQINSKNRIIIFIKKYYHLIDILLKKRNFDAIQVRDDSLMGVIALVFAKIKKIPFVFWISFPGPEAALTFLEEQGHNIGTFRRCFYWIKGRLLNLLQYKIVIPYSSHTFVQSDQMKKDLTDKGIPDDILTPVPMGIEPSDFKGVDPNNVFDSQIKNSQVLLYIGTLDKIRQVDFLFKVLRCVRKKRPAVKLLLIGDCCDDCDRDWLKNQIINSGEAINIVKTGWLPRDEAIGLLDKADVGICALPNNKIFNSMSPTKAAEMMAAGIPVVVTSHPDQGKLVREGKAGIVTSYDEKEMAEAIGKILDNEKLAEVMAKSGKEYIIKNRSYIIISEIVYKKYFEIINRA